MRVKVLGSGDAFHAAGRGHSALLVEDSDGPFLLDCGASVPLALARAGVRASQVELVVLTHLHGDHFAGLAFVLLDGMYGDVRSKPLRIVGPPGTGGRVEGAFRALYGDVASRPRPFRVDYTEVAPGGVFRLGARTFTAFAARHMSPPEVGLAWRVETDARVLAVSGDSAHTDALAHACAGADLFVCECTVPGPELADPPGSHMSVGALARLRPTWTARRVLLYHLGEQARREAAALAGVEISDDGWQTDL